MLDPHEVTKASQDVDSNPDMQQAEDAVNNVEAEIN